MSEIAEFFFQDMAIITPRASLSPALFAALEDDFDRIVAS
jgi:hypothetical protein